MPTFVISFDVPAAAIPRLQALLEYVNRDRIIAGNTPYTSVNEMAENILRNRLILLVKEAERSEVNEIKKDIRDATPEQIEAILAILNQ